MGVKEVPVPTGEEAQEPQEEQVEEVLVEELPEIVSESKPVKEDVGWTKVAPKRKAKAKKEEEKVDLKQRMPCPICKKMQSLHCLLYTHQCTKDAREAKQKKSAVLVKPPEKEEVIAPPLPEPVIEERRPVSYREALIERRHAYEARQRELHCLPIRNYFGRAY